MYALAVTRFSCVIYRHQQLHQGLLGLEQQANSSSGSRLDGSHGVRSVGDERWASGAKPETRQWSPLIPARLHCAGAGVRKVLSSSGSDVKLLTVSCKFASGMGSGWVLFSASTSQAAPTQAPLCLFTSPAPLALLPPALTQLAIVRQGPRLLLGRKKRGFGEGYVNGFGGKVRPPRTPPAGAPRARALGASMRRQL